MEKKSHTKDDTTSSSDQNMHLENYERAVNVWISSYQQWQKATSEAIKLYAEGIEKCLQTSNTDTMKKYNQLWEEGWNLSGKNDLSAWYLKSWENVWKDLGYDSMNTYAQYWKEMYEKYNKTMLQNTQEVIHRLKEQNAKKSS